MDKMKVTDIYMNAYIRAKGHREVDIEVDEYNGRDRVVFVYDKTDELEVVMEEFIRSKFMREVIREYLLSKRQISEQIGGRW